MIDFEWLIFDLGFNREDGILRNLKLESKCFLGMFDFSKKKIEKIVLKVKL